MNYKFSHKLDGLKPSAIREILKYSSKSDVIPFSAGNPPSEAFPINDIQKITNDILKNKPVAALQYGVSEGYEKLRNYLKEDLSNRFDINCDNDVIIVSGAQQAIDLVTRTFCNCGDVVICENPTFIGAITAFKSNNVNLVGVNLENNGVDVEKLEKAFKQNPNAKIFYTIPNFQNPTGITTSEEKRACIYNLAKKYGVIVLEDNPYGDLRFDDEDINPIKSLDDEGIVIYVGSFSKIFSPGLRVGYISAKNKITQKLVILKQANDVHTNLLSQITVFDFLTKYDIKAHINKLKKLYKHKYDLMNNCINKYIKGYKLNYIKPKGGLFIWLELPESIDMLDFCNKAIKDHSVALIPGNVFYIGQNIKSNAFRANYSAPSDSQIECGIKIIGNMLK